MRHSIFLLLLIAILLSTGCTSNNKNVAPTPVITVTQAPVLQESPVPTLTENLLGKKDPIDDNTEDKKFLEAAEICFNKTPVISDIKTNLEFTICMQHTPKPTGECAKQFRWEILTYTTEDDSTTAGFKRETYNMGIARSRFQECMNWQH